MTAEKADQPSDGELAEIAAYEEWKAAVEAGEIELPADPEPR